MCAVYTRSAMQYFQAPSLQNMAVPFFLLGDSQQQGGPSGSGAGSSAGSGADVTHASNASGGARQKLSQRSNDSYFCARLKNFVVCIFAFIFLVSLFTKDPVPLTAAQAFACRIGVCPVQLYKPRYEVVWESMKIALSMLVMYA